jgi:membrane protein
MTWMWMSAIVVLFGAELNSEIECQALRPSSTTPGPCIAVTGGRPLVQVDPDGQSIGL